jgi:hypothetical protein
MVPRSIFAASSQPEPGKWTAQDCLSGGKAALIMMLMKLPLLILPVLMAVSLQANATDWLIDPSPFKAQVLPSADGREITLDNGLVRRVIRLAPNAATIAFDNLVTGEPLLRSARPEARVEIEGVAYEVGGLTGQPVHNYLDEEWVGQLQAEPGAFQFTRLQIGKTEARFPWKKRLEWMPQDMPWPPPGASLTLEFAAPADFGRETRPLQVLLADDFTKLAPEWKLVLSPRHGRTSFQNEGKVGEIMAPANNFAYAERPWPEGARAVQCLVNPGTDQGASWGPGIALVHAGGVVKFNLRPAHGCFGLSINGAESEPGKLEPGKACALKLALGAGRVVCEASYDGKTWQKIGEARLVGAPTAVRVGKMDKQGGASDFSEDGPLERCRIAEFRILGPGALPPGLTPRQHATVEVHYELFDGLPLVSKWIVVRNAGDQPMRLNRFVSEILAVVEPESIVDDTPSWQLPNLLAETDYAFGGMSGPNHSAGVFWGADPLYRSQVNYNRRTPCLLECRPPQGPDQIIAPGGSLTSFRAYELAVDTNERERKTLAVRRMYRTIAPWVTENPVLMHIRSAEPGAVRLAIDQCAETGFEMAVLTFGSGFDFENPTPEYQAGIRELADYARGKGIALGGYSLLASRGAATAEDNTQGVPALFGVMPCLGAQWGSNYLAQLRHFIASARLGVLEHDGSYPGDRCAATNHPFHRGLDDSQWVQWKAITSLYQWCRAQGVYLNIPDWYFLNGGNKTGMGYREENWSLPRAYQEIIERQNIFDGTWDKTPSMGWMFVPLTEYQGGGAAATIEPLKEHLEHYEQRLKNLFGAGVIACYRGPRLYDSMETKTVVKRWVDFYQRHRAILNSDILHLRRADGRDLDYLMHVNPALKEKGLLMVYNPLNREVAKTLKVPLYYTGLKETAAVRPQDGEAQAYKLDRDYSIQLPVQVPARGTAWFVIE